MPKSMYSCAKIFCLILAEILAPTGMETELNSAPGLSRWVSMQVSSDSTFRAPVTDPWTADSTSQLL